MIKNAKARDNNFAAQEAEHALKAVVEAFNRVGDRMIDFGQQVKNRATEIDEPNSSSLGVTATDRATWTVNEIENLMRNLNFSELSRLIARLSLTQYKAGQIK